MEAHLLSLQKCTLFANASAEDLQKMYTCIAARERVITRGTFVFQAGDKVRFVYLILSGSMHIIDQDFFGNQSIIETMNCGTLFGESYVLSLKEKQLVSVIAAENSVVLEIDPARLFGICPNGCPCHAQLIRSTLFILSEKIVRITRKMGHIMRRTIRQKLLSYLSSCAQQENCNSFSIPYSRQQLADYLCVDRSALSHELSRLKASGVIRYKKNHFELLAEHPDTPANV
jgi:cAMP-binding proteins - catabolite gene activator and regulatory subunit of cAMP-dependent protein kinases